MDIVEIVEHVVDCYCHLLGLGLKGSFGYHSTTSISVDGCEDLHLFDLAQVDEVVPFEESAQSNHYFLHLLKVLGVLEFLTGSATDFFEEVQCISEVQRLIVGIVIGVCLFE